MAQAYVNYVKNLEKQKNASVQTGTENVNIVYRLPNNKMIRLYYSNIYKEKVVSFNICFSKKPFDKTQIFNYTKCTENFIFLFNMATNLYGYFK